MIFTNHATFHKKEKGLPSFYPSTIHLHSSWIPTMATACVQEQEKAVVGEGRYKQFIERKCCYT